MGHGAGQPADHLHLSRLAQLHVRLAPLGHFLGEAQSRAAGRQVLLGNP
jgi:hypothetical protein